MTKPVTRRPLGTQHRAHHLPSGLLASGCVHVEVAEEHIRIAGRRSAALGVVVTLDVDGHGDRSEGIAESSGPAIGAGDTVALRLKSLDDQFQVGHIERNVG